MQSYSEIKQAVAAQDFERARDLLREAIKAEPESAEVWYLAALAGRNAAQKRAFLEKSIELDPLFAPALDALSELDHPQPDPVVMALPVALPVPIGRRVGAWVIDAVLVGILQLVGFMLLTVFLVPVPVESLEMISPAAMDQGALAMVVLLLAPILYYTLSMTAMHGQTPGKRMLGLRVVKRDGSPLTAWDAFLRCYIGYMLSGASFGIGYLWAFNDPRQQGWHDMVADTLVVQA